jgi:fucose 4-O-acetylase-like acetyltransferase
MGAAPRAAPVRLDARALASATPATRNRYVDLIRVVSIGVVVLGHWLLAVLGYRDGAFTGQNLLEVDPGLQILTWVFQVMPLFFIVGGFTNAMSWSSAQVRGTSYADWLRSRSARLLRPALWFVGFWTILPVLAVAAGVLPSSVARVGGGEVALPLWFLAVYSLAVAAAPPLLALHRRYGVRLLVALAAGVFAVDTLRFGLDVPVVGIANYGLVWLAAIELGFLWRDGALRSGRWIPWAMASGGLAALGVLVGWFDYPVSMIGLTHGVRSNTLPPSGALLALAVWQCGAILLLEDAANRWLSRDRPWLAVVVANSMVMTCYLWNMSAVVLAAAILFPTGLAPQPEPLTPAWWWLRPAWIVACAICLIPFVLGFRWAERPVPVALSVGAGTSALARTLTGVVTAAAGLGILASEAFPVPGEALAVPAVGAALVVAGAALLGVDPVAPLRARPSG